MAKVTDIQDKNGATREIQDKDLANRTSQSSIASSDYVLLEDTNGAYHKIAKASFTEAVRGALGSVINSVAKGTDIAKVPVLDSNNDLGMGTLSNLASVLGGQVSSETASDFNSYTEVKKVYVTVNENTLNKPDPSQSWNASGLLEVKKAYDKRLIQEFTVFNDNVIYSRLRGNNNAWTSWVRNDNYGTTSLEGLASALGVKLGSVDSYVSSLNIQTPRDIITGMWNAQTHSAPSTNAEGMFMYISSGYGSGSYGIQIAIAINTSNGTVTNIYLRGSWGSSWGTWKTIPIS